MFSHPSEAEQLALAGQQQSVMLPSLRTVTAVPVVPERPESAPRRSRSTSSAAPQAPGGRHHAHPDFPETAPRPSFEAPRAPTVVVPGPRTPPPDPDVPELLPKTTEGLQALAESAESLTSKLRLKSSENEEERGAAEEAGAAEDTERPEAQERRPGQERRAAREGRRAAAPAGLNWSAVARCTSANDPKAVTPGGAHGLYHLTLEDWASAGGTGLPSEATAQEQTRRARILYVRENGRWQALWPECGEQLFTK